MNKKEKGKRLGGCYKNNNRYQCRKIRRLLQIENSVNKYIGIS